MSFGRFLYVLGILFIIQLPSCAIIIMDDAGRINYFEYELLIETSKTIMSFFWFPLMYLFYGKYDGLNIIIYFTNLLILSIVVWLFVELFLKLTRWIIKN